MFRALLVLFAAALATGASALSLRKEVGDIVPYDDAVANAKKILQDILGRLEQQ